MYTDIWSYLISQDAVDILAPVVHHPFQTHFLQSIISLLSQPFIDCFMHTFHNMVLRCQQQHKSRQCKHAEKGCTDMGVPAMILQLGYFSPEI